MVARSALILPVNSSLSVARLIAFEPHAIETEKTFARAQPKVAVPRLLDRDDIIRDAVPDGPARVIQALDGAIQRLTDAPVAQGMDANKISLAALAFSLHLLNFESSRIYI